MNAKKVTAAIIWNSGKLLIAQRPQEDRFSGKWEFPGGKLEDGESPEQCLKRELQEEFGVNATIGDFLGKVVYDYIEGSIELLIYEISQVEGDFMLFAHQQIGWVDPKDLDKFDLLGADKIVAKEFIGVVHNGF